MKPMENILKGVSGVYSTKDLIIHKHMYLVFCGFVFGITFAFLLMNVISKNFQISKYLTIAHAFSADVDGEEQYFIKKPNMFSDIIISLFAVIYLKFTGKKVWITSPFIRWSMRMVNVIILILILLSIIYLSNNIIVYPAPLP